MPFTLQSGIKSTAFAFRGYNITNLGRSPELLAHPAYGPTVQSYLQRASEISSDLLHRKVDLVRRVRNKREAPLSRYGDSIALIVAMELAQIRLLDEFHQVDYRHGQLAFGYSLGEISALACGGVFDLEQALIAPLTMAKDCAELAKDVRMGIVFSRGPQFNPADIVRLCLQINVEGKGVIGLSSILAPNAVLILGQGDTVKRFESIMNLRLPQQVHLRMNQHRWPPLHTSIVWQKFVPCRAAQIMHTMEGGFAPPVPPVISLVTGRQSYNDYNARELLHQWVDHPQRLWDAVCEVLNQGVETVVHVGPEPNLIVATFKRLSDNIEEQVSDNSWSKWGMRAVSGMARRPWLAALLPQRTSLFRATDIRHIILEDWLLEQIVQ